MLHECALVLFEENAFQRTEELLQEGNFCNYISSYNILRDKTLLVNALPSKKFLMVWFLAAHLTPLLASTTTLKSIYPLQ